MEELGERGLFDEETGGIYDKDGAENIRLVAGEKALDGGGYGWITTTSFVGRFDNGRLGV